ncbi:MAG: AtpZ/AtpI family protein [Bdellovibrionaceae bacterium]|nr:AtpZ/AtpI family protein [Pseudobdellovibrionaceae bacterium]
MNKYVLFIGIGFELIGLIVVSLLVSNYFEEKYQTKGTLTSVVILIALIGWFIHIYFLLSKVNKATEVDKKNDNT